MEVDEYRKTIRSLFREFQCFGVNHFVPLHGQFNNLNTTSLPTKKYLEKLSSFHDLDLFSLNTASNINPDQNLVDIKIHSRYFFGVIYGQHNSPESFQTYFDETLEKLSTSGKPIYVMGDFNINLLNAETCNFTTDFLLSLQSYSLIPTIDKPH